MPQITLKRGTVVHAGGFPVALVDDTAVETTTDLQEACFSQSEPAFENPAQAQFPVTSDTKSESLESM